MIAAYDEHGRSVLALHGGRRTRRSPATAASAAEPVGDRLVQVLDIVEKPEPAEAPSNLAVMGRYVLHPRDLRRPRAGRSPGSGGELQLTDAIALLLGEPDACYGYTFTEGRYDIGKKLDYLRGHRRAGAAAAPTSAPSSGPFLRASSADREGR